MSEQVPIIVKKKVTGHGGHHGGAWKVAYADFVTAMMSLFMVLWLMNTSKKVQESVGGYFRDPSGVGKLSGNRIPGYAKSEKDNLEELKAKLEQAIRQMPGFKDIKEQVKLTMTSEGLRIELLESAKGTFFESGNSKPTAHGNEMLVLLARELSKTSNPLLIEGHTDAKPYASDGTYSNWELSTDRANSARRLMQANGVAATRVAQVRGYADQKLFKADDPLDPSNRRVSVLVEYEKPLEQEVKPEEILKARQAAESDRSANPEQPAPSPSH
jgi:chemotaxis protein MotB